MSASRWIGIAVLSCGVTACIALPLFTLSAPAPGRSASTEFQCGHWAVYRCSELLGVPLETNRVVELLPASNNGHSLLDLASAFETVGLSAVGRRVPIQQLADESVPCVAHLRDPDHFVVVVAVGEARVHLFDGAGQRVTWTMDSFLQHWSGNILCVRRDDGEQALPAFVPVSGSAPRIQFDTLRVEKGDIPAEQSGRLTFTFPFRNVGTSDLVVKAVRADCSCIEVERPEAPILPGERGEIHLRYESGVDRGWFLHEAVVESNDPRFPRLALKAGGFVDSLIEVEPKQVNLQRVIAGQAHTVPVFVRYFGSQRDFKVESVETDVPRIEYRVKSIDDSQDLESTLPELGAVLRAPDNACLIEVIFKPPVHFSGSIDGVLSVVTNVPGSERVQVPVSARVVPPIQAAPSVLTYDVVEPGEFVEANLRLVSLSDEPFDVLAIESEIRAMTWSEIEPSAGGERRVSITIPAADAVRLSGTTLQVRVRTGRSATDLRIPVRLRVRPGRDGQLRSARPVSAQRPSFAARPCQPIAAFGEPRRS